MENYARKLAKDRTDAPMQEYALPFPALATTNRENAAASSVTSLNANCTAVEVAAVGGNAAIRWSMATATTSVITIAGTANFDNYIPSGTLRRFVVPRQAQAIPNYSGINSPSVVGLNLQEGLYTGIATIGAASVLVTQY